MPLLQLVAKALIMLFLLRFLIQLSNAYYFSPLVQSVVKLTNPVCNLPGLSKIRLGRVYLSPLIAALAVDLIFWLCVKLFTRLPIPVFDILTFTVLQTVKTFGVLVISLLLIQALTSWLPSTRNISETVGQITYPLVSPVQKIIPPIGMIDISLMIVLLVIFAINRLMTSWLGPIWIML
ncbi:YGGT family [Anaerobiospirillum thomasii]|uniref:YggT family protein n=1 Tax=Anaerobiospirillum thomasii TaxID=179995 RepID=UPI000DA1049B|nr:YggT family protein [Anaerobiospirillum thomasii]SPT72120.1 YGGT family [Anaerobiospirillum thomasii]